MTGNKCSDPKNLSGSPEYSPNLHDVEIAHTLFVLGLKRRTGNAGPLAVNTLFISGKCVKPFTRAALILLASGVKASSVVYKTACFRSISHCPIYPPPMKTAIVPYWR